MALARDFTELEVYRNAYTAAMEVFRLSKGWPPEERYALTDQIRRSSRSVCANVAEAWKKRLYPSHFVSKLSDADCEAGETITWLHFARGCEYLNEDSYALLNAEYRSICAILTTMMNHPEKWCSNRSRKRPS
jgi:four helix bundle protein